MEDIRQLYDIYSKDIYKFVISLTLNHEAAEDIMQNTFISAMKNLNTFNGRSTVKTWLIGIAKNEYYTYLRKSPINVQLEEIHEITYKDDNKEIYMTIMEEIYKLQEPQKQILILRLINEMPFREIGDVVVKDILPLYLDDLVSNETKDIVKEHLLECEDCSKYLSLVKEDNDLNLEIEKDEIDKSGEKIIKKIKKSQDRIKYTFILFSMIIAVSNGWLSKGFMSTIPLIIIIPCVLSIFYKEGKVILLTSICLNLILSIAKDSFDFGLISTPFLIIAVMSGILLGKVIKERIDKEI